MITLTVRMDNISGPGKAMLDSLRDFSPALRRIGREVVLPAYRRNFESGSGALGWTFRGYQSSPPMVKSGALKRALTQENALGNVFKVNKQDAEFGVEEYLPDYKGRGSRRYPAWHHMGWRQVRTGSFNRHVLFKDFSAADLAKMNDILSEYITRLVMQPPNRGRP